LKCSCMTKRRLPACVTELRAKGVEGTGPEYGCDDTWQAW
jgi:hypothetical protein